MDRNIRIFFNASALTIVNVPDRLASKQTHSRTHKKPPNDAEDIRRNDSHKILSLKSTIKGFP